MGIDPFNLRQAFGLTQQIVVNGHFNFTANFQIRLNEPVQCMADDTLVGVFHRNHAKIRLGGLHLCKNVIDTGHPKRLYRMAKMLVNRLLCKGAFRTEIGDFQWFLLGQANGHDFPKQTQHLCITDRTLIAFPDCPENLGLTFRPVIINGIIEFTL